MKISRILWQAYNTSPAEWVKLMRLRLAPFLFKKVNTLTTLLSKTYFAKRDPLVQYLIEQIREGKELEQTLEGFKGKNYDERIVEYPYFINWLLQQKKVNNILDVGCTLNNKLVQNTLKERCNNVWLCNVAIESKIYVTNSVFYHISSLEKVSPNNKKFPIITCLSTIEHIGFDNSQYGDKTPAKYTKPTDKPLLVSLRKLAKLLKLGGKLLVSFPYGYREVVIHPKTCKIASQVFDFSSVKKGLSILKSEGVTSKVEVFKATNTGWVKTDPKTFNKRYADGCPAASAVALITGQKNKKNTK